MNLIPDKRFFVAFYSFLATAFLLVILRIFSEMDLTLISAIWWVLITLMAALLLTDAYLVKFTNSIHAWRKLPSNLALGSDCKIQLKFENNSKRPIKFSYTDSYPATIKTEQLPSELSLQPGEIAIAKYTARPIKRGPASFNQINLRVQSPFNFWRYQKRINANQTTKIYPNFMAIANLSFLDYEQRLAHIGAHLSQRRGSGQSFKQLREYQRGDEIRQIDWKATSRQHKLISREYQDERDQEIIFMLDCGRRMRAQDGDLSHFDHSINALLLTSYMALSAGDAVGMMSFSGDSRWIKPIKGKNKINTLLNSLYDLHSSLENCDLASAAQQLMLKQQKRSLIIVITNLRDEDSDDLLQSVKLLTKKHLVMIACLKERNLENNIQVTDIKDALLYTATHLYTQQRQALIRKLKAQGVLIADSIPESMHVSLVNEYMLLKRSGRI